MTMIEREAFLKLPTAKVAKLVRAAEPQVCVPYQWSTSLVCVGV